MHSLFCSLSTVCLHKDLPTRNEIKILPVSMMELYLCTKIKVWSNDIPVAMETASQSSSLDSIRSKFINNAAMFCFQKIKLHFMLNWIVYKCYCEAESMEYYVKEIIVAFV